jgi:DNA ligase-1
MTILSGLSKAITGSKDSKTILENAFNVCSDLGEVAERAVRNGIQCLQRVRPAVGKPVRMMLAQRVKDLKEVSDHITGPVDLEYKYDGERVQAHIPKRGNVVLYSRRHENITHQFPDVARSLRQAFRDKAAILEGEIVAIDPKTERLKDFQTLMQRRRKHDVEAYMGKIPVKYFLFDVLYLGGRSLIQTRLGLRRKMLARSTRESDTLGLAVGITVANRAAIERFFMQAIERGAEGVVIKDPQSVYEPGMRGWRWIKYKKEYRKELADSFDLVVVGSIHGRGMRARTFGSLLVAAFNPKTNHYETFTKVGTGFSDAELARLPKLLKPYQISARDRLVDTRIKADVWFAPALVLEVTGAQITISPVHLVAHDQLVKGGLALRFPRFLKWRSDKQPEQATTAQEIFEMFKAAR